MKNIFKGFEIDRFLYDVLGHWLKEAYNFRRLKISQRPFLFGFHQPQDQLVAHSACLFFILLLIF
jgi:hypothetical protein